MASDTIPDQYQVAGAADDATDTVNDVPLGSTATGVVWINIAGGQPRPEL